MTFNNVVNLGATIVATPPDPALSGTTITVASGTGSSLGATPFRCSSYAPGTPQTQANTEFMLATAITGDVVTVLRAQEDSTAQPIAAGWVFDLPATAGTYQELQAAVTAEVSRATGAEGTLASATATVAAGLASEIARAEGAEGGAAQKAANLSDLPNVGTARTNLGLGSAATQASSAFDAAGAATTAQSNAETFATAAANAVAAGIPFLPPVQLVATGNVASLSGSQTIDGTASANLRVLLTGQSTPSQDGVWQSSSGGAWSRPTDFPHAGVIGARVVAVQQGTANANTLWQLQTSASLTIDTGSQTWSEIAGGGGSLATGASVSGATASTLFVADGSSRLQSGPATAAVLVTNDGSAAPTWDHTIGDQAVLYHDVASGEIKGQTNLAPPAGFTTGDVLLGASGGAALGRLAVSSGASGNFVTWGSSGPVYSAPPKIRESRTFAVSGTLAAASGATNFIPPFFEPVASGTTKTLIGVKAAIRGGTSATVDVTQNGTGVTGLTAVSVTPTPGSTAATGPPSVSDGDEFAIVLSSPTGTPDGLTVTLIFETTL